MNVRRSTILALVLAVTLQLTGLFDHSLWTPDEPRVAEICREMAISGDYLIPHFVNKPFLEQPPLYYACAAGFVKAFGCDNEGFGRLASFCFALGTLLVVFWASRRLFSERVAALAVLMLSSSVGFFQTSHKMLVDNALCFSITFALLSFIMAYTGRLRSGYKLFWLGLGLAFLSKGLIGVAIPVVTVGLFMIWQKDFEFRKLEPAAALLFVGLPLLAFELALYQKGGLPYLWTFNVYNQVGRFVSGSLYDGGHVRPFYYYLSNIWLEGAPWSLLLIPLCLKLRKPDMNIRFLLSWFVGGMVLLSISATKRGLYLLPLMPALMVLLAAWIDSYLDLKVGTVEKITLGIIVGLIAVGSLILPWGYIKLGGSYSVAVLAFFIALAGLGVVVRLKYTDITSLAILGWSLLMVVWVPAVFPVVDQHKSYKNMFIKVGQRVTTQPTAGFMLNESVEAFAPYYGKFYVKNVEDEGAFLALLEKGDAEYLIILPNRLGSTQLKQELNLHAERILTYRSKYLKPVELWRRTSLRASTPITNPAI